MKRVTLGAVLRECKRRGIRFANIENDNAYIDKMKKLGDEAFSFFYDLRQDSFEGAGSRFVEKDNPLRTSPEARQMKDLIQDIYGKVKQLQKVTNSLRKYKK